MQEVEKTDSACVIAAAAHDLNNELTIILSSAAVAIHGLTLDNPARPWLLEIRCAAQRSASKASTLLDFSVGIGVRPGAASLDSIIESCTAARSSVGVH
jgi:hypothetical protein